MTDPGVCGNLRQVLKKEPLPKDNENVARIYVCELLVAIEHIHDRDILYRDLRPENIWVDEDGHLKIAEFGLSKILSNLFERSNSISYGQSYTGIPPYMAPEMLTTIFPYGKSADWYCLGVLVYEFLHGEAPFLADTEEEMITNMRMENLTLSKHISAEARDLIARLLQTDDENRPGAEEIKAHPWFTSVDWSVFEAARPDPESLGEVPERSCISMNTARKRRAVSDMKEIQSEEKSVD